MMHSMNPPTRSLSVAAGGQRHVELLPVSRTPRRHRCRCSSTSTRQRERIRVIASASQQAEAPPAAAAHLDTLAASHSQHAEQENGSSTTLELRASVITSMGQFGKEEWDAVANSSGESNPFVGWSFLNALEESGSVTPKQGWAPQHIIVRDSAGVLQGCCPLYLKSHSYGEYVFDSSWANYAAMTGQRYYPKLQSCVPFAPVTGPRLLARQGKLHGAILKALGQTLMTVAESMGVSSLHITFLPGAEWAALAPLGFQQRRGIQYHWDNHGYDTFEDFLTELKQSKRKMIRQERKSVAKQGLHISRLPGTEVTAAGWDRFYDCYMATMDKHWGRGYLTRDFWHRLADFPSDQVMLVTAHEQGTSGSGNFVAAALNLVGSHAMYGRQWGCVEGANYKHLHFELCYYQAIEEAIQRRLPRVEAGAQGEHKMARGYVPNFTYSSHYMCNPMMRRAVGSFLDREAIQLQNTWQVLSLEASPYKQERTINTLLDKMSSYASLASASSMDGGSVSSQDDQE